MAGATNGERSQWAPMNELRGWQENSAWGASYIASLLEDCAAGQTWEAGDLPLLWPVVRSVK